MKVKPVEGRMVRDPRSMQLLPEEGRDVPDTMFWRRRIRDGDVIAEEAPAGPADAPSPRRAVPAHPEPTSAPTDAERG